MSRLRRVASPTAERTGENETPSEGRADPHGIHWMRGAAPIDANTYSAPSNLDVVAESVSRHSDSHGDGTGTGRRASGFRLLGGGTVTLTTGSGATNTYNGQTLPAGYGETVEFTRITSSDAAGVVVFW
jgi:hypothetical protein